MYKWDEMTSRERDVLVCKEVFGWQKFISMEADDDFYVVDDLQELQAIYPVPNYTTNLGETFSVIDKLQDDKVLHFKLDRSYCLAQMWWYAEFEDLDGKKHSAFMPKVAEAVCVAALKTIGIEIE